MDPIDASLQRGPQSGCERADGPTPSPDRGCDLPGIGHSRDHPLELAQGLAQPVALLLASKNRQGRHPHRQQKHESLLGLGCQITRRQPTC